MNTLGTGFRHSPPCCCSRAAGQTMESAGPVELRVEGETATKVNGSNLLTRYSDSP